MLLFWKKKATGEKASSAKALSPEELARQCEERVVAFEGGHLPCQGCGLQIPSRKLEVLKMNSAAEELRFEYAARLRDEIKELKRELRDAH